MCLFWMVMRDVIQSLPTPGYLSNFPSLYVLFYHITNRLLTATFSAQHTVLYSSFRTFWTPSLSLTSCVIQPLLNGQNEKFCYIQKHEHFKIFSSLWTGTVYPSLPGRASQTQSDWLGSTCELPLPGLSTDVLSLRWASTLHLAVYWIIVVLNYCLCSFHGALCMYLYVSIFILLSVLISLPVPAIEKHSHSMTPPPRLYMVCVSSEQRTLSLMFS